MKSVDYEYFKGKRWAQVLPPTSDGLNRMTEDK
jgi:hypothetical protein